MNENKRYNQRGLERLTDALVDDILNESPEEILAEYENDPGGADAHIAKMRALIEKGVTKANKKRLADAKAGVAESHSSSNNTKKPINISEARRLFNSLPEKQRYTLAARKESELSDNDIISIVEDLRELNILPEDNKNNGK